MLNNKETFVLSFSKLTYKPDIWVLHVLFVRSKRPLEALREALWSTLTSSHCYSGFILFILPWVHNAAVSLGLEGCTFICLYIYILCQTASCHNFHSVSLLMSLLWLASTSWPHFFCCSLSNMVGNAKETHFNNACTVLASSNNGPLPLLDDGSDKKNLVYEILKGQGKQTLSVLAQPHAL